MRSYFGGAFFVLFIISFIVAYGGSQSGDGGDGDAHDSSDGHTTDDDDDEYPRPHPSQDMKMSVLSPEATVFLWAPDEKHLGLDLSEYAPLLKQSAEWTNKIRICSSLQDS
jgi:hypothetical protein